MLGPFRGVPQNKSISAESSSWKCTPKPMKEVSPQAGNGMPPRFGVHTLRKISFQGGDALWGSPGVGVKISTFSKICRLYRFGVAITFVWSSSPGKNLHNLKDIFSGFKMNYIPGWGRPMGPL